MPIRRTVLSSTKETQTFPRIVAKPSDPAALVAPGSPVNTTPSQTPTDGPANLHQDPDIILAQKKIDDLTNEETKASLEVLQANTNRAAWLEQEQNSREILRSSKQFHFDIHKNHISTEYEAAQDEELAIRRNQAIELGLTVQTEYDQARVRLREIRDQLAEAKQDHARLVKYKMTGQWEEDINNYLNPFVRFGPWGQKYGWYLFAFIVFAILVLWFIH